MLIAERSQASLMQTDWVEEEPEPIYACTQACPPSR